MPASTSQGLQPATRERQRKTHAGDGTMKRSLQVLPPIWTRLGAQQVILAGFEVLVPVLTMMLTFNGMGGSPVFSIRARWVCHVGSGGCGMFRGHVKSSMADDQRRLLKL